MVVSDFFHQQYWWLIWKLKFSDLVVGSKTRLESENSLAFWPAAMPRSILHIPKHAAALQVVPEAKWWGFFKGCSELVSERRVVFLVFWSGWLAEATKEEDVFFLGGGVWKCCGCRIFGSCFSRFIARAPISRVVSNKIRHLQWETFRFGKLDTETSGGLWWGDSCDQLLALWKVSWVCVYPMECGNSNRQWAVSDSGFHDTYDKLSVYQPNVTAAN